MLHFNDLRKLIVGAVVLSLFAASVPARRRLRSCRLQQGIFGGGACDLRSYPLGQAEARMVTLFGVVTSLVAMGQRGDIGDAQRKWLKERNAFGDDSACIARIYHSRITALSAALDAIASRGPFWIQLVHIAAIGRAYTCILTRYL
jgi:hypothetical protein